MAAFAPQTASDSSWFYHPSARAFEGVRITHQPSPWIADYGTVIFLPQKFTRTGSSAQAESFTMRREETSAG